MQENNQQQQLDLHVIRVWRRAFEAVNGNIMKDMERYQLAKENFMILELLYNKGPHPVQQISKTLVIPSGSITYVVDKLEKKDLVQRQTIPTDRRASCVVITEEGKMLFDDIFPKHVATISKNLAFLSNEEKEHLMDLLKKVGKGAQGLSDPPS